VKSVCMKLAVAFAVACTACSRSGAKEPQHQDQAPPIQQPPSELTEDGKDKADAREPSAGNQPAPLPVVTAPPAVEQKPEEQKAEPQKAEERKPEEQKAEPQKAEEPKPEEQKAEEQKPPAVEKTEEQKPEQQKAEEQKPAEQKPEEQKAASEQKPPEQPAQQPAAAKVPTKHESFRKLEQQRLFIVKLDRSKLVNMIATTKPASEEKLRPLLQGSGDPNFQLLLKYLTESNFKLMNADAAQIADETYKNPSMVRPKIVNLRSALEQIADQDLLEGDLAKRVLYLQTVLDSRVVQDEFDRSIEDVAVLIGTSAVLGWAAGLAPVGRWLGRTGEAQGYSFRRAAAVGGGTLLLDSLSYSAGRQRAAVQGEDYGSLYLESLIPADQLRDMLRE
jgi:hypothetical protein